YLLSLTVTTALGGALVPWHRVPLARLTTLPVAYRYGWLLLPPGRSQCYTTWSRRTLRSYRELPTSWSHRFLPVGSTRCTARAYPPRSAARSPSRKCQPRQPHRRVRAQRALNAFHP